MKEKTNEIRHSLNKMPSSKPQSLNKYNTSVSPGYPYSSALNDEDKDKLKRKQSLKDILKNKR
jgi:hypothetical protein